MTELEFAEMSLALERRLVALVDPIHDTRLWDEHRVRIERLEQVVRDLGSTSDMPVYRYEDATDRVVKE
jgi:hypothetical protein